MLHEAVKSPYVDYEYYAQSLFRHRHTRTVFSRIGEKGRGIFAPDNLWPG